MKKQFLNWAYHTVKAFSIRLAKWTNEFKEYLDAQDSNTPAPSQPVSGDYVIPFAYDICRDSWMFALYQKQQKTKLWTYIYILVFLFLISVAVFPAFDSTEGGFGKCVENNWLFFVLLLIEIVLIVRIIYYYCRESKHLDKWSGEYQSMVVDLDKNKGVYLECTKDDKDRMSNFINKYRYDNWMKQKKEKK